MKECEARVGVEIVSFFTSAVEARVRIRPKYKILNYVSQKKNPLTLNRLMQQVLSTLISYIRV